MRTRRRGGTKRARTRLLTENKRPLIARLGKSPSSESDETPPVKRSLLDRLGPAAPLRRSSSLTLFDKIQRGDLLQEWKRRSQGGVQKFNANGDIYLYWCDYGDAPVTNGSEAFLNHIHFYIKKYEGEQSYCYNVKCKGNKGVSRNEFWLDNPKESIKDLVDRLQLIWQNQCADFLKFCQCCSKPHSTKRKN